MIAADRHRTLVERYFECANTEDWDGMRELWHDDAEFVAVGARPRVGREEIVAYFPHIFSLWSEHRDEPTRILVAGDVVTAEVRFTGRTPGGKRVEFDAVDVIDVRDGKILRLTNWYDIAYARKQLAES